MDLKNIKKTSLPERKNINLVRGESSPAKFGAKVALGAFVFVFLGAGTWFGIIEPNNEISSLKKELAVKEEELAAVQRDSAKQKVSDEDILRYSVDYMTEDEQKIANKTEVFEIIDKYLVSSGCDVTSLELKGNELTTSINNADMEDGSRISKNLLSDEGVYFAKANSAVNSSGLNDNMKTVKLSVTFADNPLYQNLKDAKAKLQTETTTEIDESEGSK